MSLPSYVSIGTLNIYVVATGNGMYRKVYFIVKTFLGLESEVSLAPSKRMVMGSGSKRLNWLSSAIMGYTF